MTKTASKVLAWCKNQLGVTESPANSNRVKYWDTYKQHTGVSYQGEPWCAAFVSAAEWYGGVEPWASTYKDLAFLRYCPSMVTKAQALGIWLGRTSTPKPGDVVIFGNGSIACHIGIVEKRISATCVQTFEGNTSAGDNANGGQVQRRIRDYGKIGSGWYILGFIRPKYAREKAATPTHKISVASLNIRKKATVNSEIAGTYKRGELVQVTETKTYRNGNVWGKTALGWIALRHKGETYAKEV